MKLLHPLFESPFFIFSDAKSLLRALGDEITPAEHSEIEHLIACGLPPISSTSALAAMFGISPGLIGSFTKNPEHYYRAFFIPKGSGQREILSPKVGLKIIQKWISIKLEAAYSVPDHVYGFVPQKSHVQAAAIHAGAKWVFSVDIKDFFQTTPKELVESRLRELGFKEKGASLIGELCTLNNHLPQGAPSSPLLSNICFNSLDETLKEISTKHSIRLSRYADDIVFSGSKTYPEELQAEIEAAFSASPWTLSPRKTELVFLPRDRLKIHGILVDGEKIRLTKGYRKRLRAFAHLMEHGKIKEEDKRKIIGHLNYGNYVNRIALSLTGD